MSSETFQIPVEVAEVYEAKFVPAIFAEWAKHLVDIAGIRSGQRVLDVGCGTGIVARTAADRAGPAGIVGVDVNKAMLAVARRVRPELEWRQADASSLPFGDASFDAVLSQAALMFVPDRLRAMSEMARLVKPGGVVAVHVPGRLEASTAHALLTEIASRHAGPTAAELLGTYFVLGDLDGLRRLFTTAGLVVVQARSRLAPVRFESIAAFVATEVEGSPLIERLDEATYASIRRDAERALAGFCTADSAVEVPIEVHLVAGRKP